MTREEIKGMKADGWKLELSNEVATRVMGWHRHPEEQYWVDGDGRWVTAWRWSPETNMQDAWQVVERMHKELFSVRMRFLQELQALTTHEVPGTGEVRITAWPDVFWTIAPETICKAALLTKEAQ